RAWLPSGGPRPPSARRLPVSCRSRCPFGDQLLGFRDRFRWIQPLGTDIRAIHDRVTAIEAEWIFEAVEPLAGGFVAAVGEPAIGLQQDGRSEEAILVPPVARAARRAAEAEDAFVQAVELRPILGALQPLLARWCRGRGLQPRLDRRILRISVREVGNEILHYLHVRQRRDLDLALDLRNCGGAGEAVSSVHVHRTASANPLAAGTAEGQGGVDLVLDLDQSVEDHWPAFVEVDRVAVEARVRSAVRIVAIDFERLEPFALFGLPLA